MTTLPVALRLARRELRGGIKGFRIFLACLALGVATIAGIGSIAGALVAGLEADLLESKNILRSSYHLLSQIEKWQKMGELPEMVIDISGEHQTVLSARFSNGTEMPVRWYEHGHIIVVMVRN